MKRIDANAIKVIEDESETDVKRKEKPIKVSLGGKCTIKNHLFMHI